MCAWAVRELNTLPFGNVNNEMAIAVDFNAADLFLLGIISSPRASILANSRKIYEQKTVFTTCQWPPKVVFSLMYGLRMAFLIESINETFEKILFHISLFDIQSGRL